MASYIAISSDNAIYLNNLQDVTTDAYVNNATCTGTLYDSAGTSLASFSLSYVTNSSGQYLGVLPHSISLTEDDVYTVEVVAVTGSYQATLRQHWPARYEPG